MNQSVSDQVFFFDAIKEDTLSKAKNFEIPFNLKNVSGYFLVGCVFGNSSINVSFKITQFSNQYTETIQVKNTSQLRIVIEKSQILQPLEQYTYELTDLYDNNILTINGKFTDPQLDIFYFKSGTKIPITQNDSQSYSVSDADKIVITFNNNGSVALNFSMKLESFKDTNDSFFSVLIQNQKVTAIFSIFFSGWLIVFAYYLYVLFNFIPQKRNAMLNNFHLND